MADELAVLGEDPDVEVGHQEDHRRPGMGPSEADLEKPTVITQGDAAGPVDSVLADSQVGLGRLGRPGWRRGP